MLELNLALGSQSTSETLMQTFTQSKGQSKLQQHNELHDQIYGSWTGDIACLYYATITRQIHGAPAPSPGLPEHCCSGAVTPYETCLRDECTVYRVELPPNVKV